MAHDRTRFKLINSAWQPTCVRLQQLGFENLHRHEQVFLAVGMLRTQVFNGGFAAYMYNHGGENAELALTGLREIGAVGAAEAVAGFFALLPGELPLRDRDAREEQLHAAREAGGEAYEQTRDRLTKQFYASKDEIEDGMLALARAHGMTQEVE